MFLKFFNKNFSGRKLLVLFIVTTALYLAMLFVSIPQLKVFSGGMDILDMKPMGYDKNYVFQLFEYLGEKGRNYYLFCQIPLDMLYPGFYSVTYSLLITYFLKKLSWFSLRFSFLCIMPILGGFFDYLENFGTIFMLISYPKIPEILPSLNNIFTIIKSIFISISQTTFLMLLLIFGIKKIFWK